MPLDVKEFIIQAKFEDEAESPTAVQQQATEYRTMKEEIIGECLEKIEELLRKRDGR
jgi:hypothetical protein